MLFNVFLYLKSVLWIVSGVLFVFWCSVKCVASCCVVYGGVCCLCVLCFVSCELRVVCFREFYRWVVLCHILCCVCVLCDDWCVHFGVLCVVCCALYIVCLWLFDECCVGNCMCCVVLCVLCVVVACCVVWL